ncbi:hypothetical protein DH2020_018239 [Rehmannia glutinosa]|uniref:Late embryogenesis abundant protein LEA-2 subgroup domain-containing protein n=1 Tax=Rehmannia glutinosa TaxID=99300 RepID=A0ABR0WLX2_REHGL
MIFNQLVDVRRIVWGLSLEMSMVESSEKTRKESYGVFPEFTYTTDKIEPSTMQRLDVAGRPTIVGKKLVGEGEALGGEGEEGGGESVQPPQEQAAKVPPAVLRRLSRRQLHCPIRFPHNLGRPPAQKPRFTLQDATIFTLNVSAPNVISTTVQVTINSRNPNSRIGVYYDKLDVYANYHNQQITYYTVIPPVYQGHKDVNVWSPFIYGNDVPVAPYNGIALSQDQSSGGIRMTIKINGRVKWKVGTFVSGRYHLHVTCPVYIPLGNSKNNGIIIGSAVKYQLSQSCSVSV